jgi:predicted aspartyl protease
MHLFSIRSAPLILLTSLIALFSLGCSGNLLSVETKEQESASTAAEATKATTDEATLPSEAVVTLTSNQSRVEALQQGDAVSSPLPGLSSSNLYRQGIDRASSAFILSRSAQSQDDWSLVARRWQQAIDLMASVPSASPDHAQAQNKVEEYRTNLTYAQQQANRSTRVGSSDSRVVIRSQPAASTARASAPAPTTPPPVAAAARPPIESVPANSSASTQQRTFYAPIVRREGNTPVIQVTFNNNQTFDMIVDTGASGTLITDRMAQALGVVPVAATRVDTASESGVVVPLGYVNSIAVNGAMTQNVMVAIAGPQLSTGLLGHDFFGGYDVTIREHEVVFRER